MSVSMFRRIELSQKWGKYAEADEAYNNVQFPSEQ